MPALEFFFVGGGRCKQRHGETGTPPAVKGCEVSDSTPKSNTQLLVAWGDGDQAALVNEAYLRLVEQKHVRWQNRAHFLAIAAQLMRRILVDYARRRQYQKRGGGALQVTLAEAESLADERAPDLVALDEALLSSHERAGAFIEEPAINVAARQGGDGAPRKVTDFKSDSIFWFDFSRDGKQLALARGTQTSDVVLISNFR
jgi:hypothetical protein